MQIANISSTLGSIGDKEQYLGDDDARRGNAFAVGGLAYKMSKAALNMRESFPLVCHILFRYAGLRLPQMRDLLQLVGITSVVGRHLWIQASLLHHSETANVNCMSLLLMAVPIITV